MDSRHAWTHIIAETNGADLKESLLDALLNFKLSYIHTSYLWTRHLVVAQFFGCERGVYAAIFEGP